MIIKLLFITGLMIQAPPETISGQMSVQSGRSDSLHTEMVLRSEDLIWKSNWDFFSIDRMSYKVNTGHYGYYGPQPAYLLNNIPFDPTFFGMNFSQLLPESFGQIQNVHTRDGIGTKSGVGFYSGLIDITSVPIKDGFSVTASGQFGHNSDEPGPWIFDRQRVTPNVERFGPWADAGASLKIGPWYAKALLRSHTYLHINPHVQTRTKNLVSLPEQGEWPDPRSTTNLKLAETGIQSKYVELNLQGIRSDSKELLYFQPVAREIPTEFTTEQYSASASISLMKSFSIRGMVQFRDKSTGYRRNRFKEEFDWNQVQKIARSSIYLDTKKYVLDIGSEYSEVETEAGGLGEYNQTFIDLFLDQKVSIIPWLSVASYTSMTIHDDEQVVRGKANLQFRPVKGWSISIQGSYSELLPERSNPVDVWIANGYDIMKQLDSYAFVPTDLSNTRLITFSNSHRFEISDWVKIHLNAEMQNHLRFHIPFQYARYYLQLSTLPDSYFLFEDQKGERIQISLNTVLNWNDSFWQSFRIHHSQTLVGDAAYKSYWQTTPDWLIRHTTFLNPYPDFGIRLNLQYQSETVWDEFMRLDGKLNRTFHPQFPYRLFSFSNKIPAGVHIDLILSKWFWEQRIRATFMLSNLFNQKYKIHPIGSQEGFGYMLRLELRI